jgi:hypothetical protein
MFCQALNPVVDSDWEWILSVTILDIPLDTVGGRSACDLQRTTGSSTHTHTHTHTHTRAPPQTDVYRWQSNPVSKCVLCRTIRHRDRRRIAIMVALCTTRFNTHKFYVLCAVRTEYGRSPLIRINCDGEPSGYAENKRHTARTPQLDTHAATTMH